MARFPYSYGSLEITKYPKAQYLNVTMPGEQQPQACIVLPVSEKWMRLYADKNGNVHADISINIDDASALNRWAAEEDAKKGRQHTDFHGQIHITPGKEGRKAWQAQLEGDYGLMSEHNLDEAAAKLHLSKADIARSEYYQQHPDRIPTREQIVTRLANFAMQQKTAAGRIYSTELTDAMPQPTVAAVATAAALPVNAEAMPQQAGQTMPQKTTHPSEQMQQYAQMLGGQGGSAAQQGDDLPF